MVGVVPANERQRNSEGLGRPRREGVGHEPDRTIDNNASCRYKMIGSGFAWPLSESRRRGPRYSWA